MLSFHITCTQASLGEVVESDVVLHWLSPTSLAERRRDVPVAGRAYRRVDSPNAQCLTPGVT
jgi:hypothetical protein